MFRTGRLLPLTAAASLALLLGAAACDGRSTDSTATGPILSTPGATTPATGPPTPTPTSTNLYCRAAPGPRPHRPRRPDPTVATPPISPPDSTTSTPAAGSRYATAALTNRTSSTCRVYGYGGVQLLDAARHPLPTHQIRDPGTPPHPVLLLSPGGSASSQLHWSPLPRHQKPDRAVPADPHLPADHPTRRDPADHARLALVRGLLTRPHRPDRLRRRHHPHSLTRNEAAT